MASPPTWSVTACLRYRGGLEIRAAAENILPGWGHGGERLSFLLRLRLVVTSQCGSDPEPDKKPRGLRLLRFLRSRVAQAPRLPSTWRRRKTPPPPRAAAVAKPGLRAPAIPSFLDRARMRPATTTALCFLAALAVAAASVAALRIMAGFMMPGASCGSWKCFLAKRCVKFLGPALFEWLSRIGLKFLDPPVELGLKWLFSK